MPRPSEDGAASLVILTGVLVFSLLAVMTVDLGAVLLARVRAQTAADAAALAAVIQQVPLLSNGDDPETVARDTAALNHALLLSCTCTVGDLTATVRVGLDPPIAMMLPWAGRRVTAEASAGVDEAVLTYRDG